MSVKVSNTVKLDPTFSQNLTLWKYKNYAKIQVNVINYNLLNKIEQNTNPHINKISLGHIKNINQGGKS